MRLKIKSVYDFCCKQNVFVILFLIILAVVTHCLFLGQFFGAEEIRIFASDGDDISQVISAGSLIENNLDEHNPFWSFSYGLGGDTYTELSYYYSTSPLFYLKYIVKSIFGSTGGMVFSQQKWKLVFSIFKQFLAMFFMYCLLRQEKKEKYTAVVGAVVYGCSFWMLRYTYYFDFMTEAVIWPPLFMMALNRYLRGKSFIPLVCVIALTVINNFYFGFNSCVLYATLFIVFSAYKRCSIKQYFINLSKFLLFSILGVLIASFAFLPAVNGLFSSDRVPSSAGIDFIPDFVQVFTLPLNLTAYSLLSLPFIIFYAFALFSKNIKRLTGIKSILSSFWVLAFLIPATANIMNGFSYSTNRWNYIVIFIIAYSLPDWIEELVHHKSVTYKGIFAFAYFLFIAYVSTKLMSGNNVDFVVFGESFPLYAICGFVSVLVLGILQNKCILIQRFKILSPYVIKFGQVLLILLIAIPNIYKIHDFCSKRFFTVNYSDEYADSILLGDENQRLMNEKLKAQKDEFYRIDDLSIYNTNERYENRSWLYRNYTISAYASELSGINKWIRRTYNVCVRYNTPSYYRGFGHRLLLENAWGVKYKVNGDNNNLPYGYYPKDIGDGLTVWENKYATGIDLWYNSAMDSGEFKKLDYAQRDALLLQTAVVDSAEDEYYPVEPDNVTSYIPLDDLSNITFNNCKFDGGILQASQNAEIVIPLSDRADDGEFLLSMRIESINDERFEMDVNGDLYTAYESSYQYNYKTNDFSFHIDGSAEKISFKITEGTYKIENLRLAFNSYSQLEKWTADVNKYNLENLNVDGGNVSGTIRNDEKGILALSIPFNEGWSCKVDGKKVPLIKVNEVFTGIELEAGQHEIELHFIPPYLILGTVISAAAIAILILFNIQSRRRKMRRGALREKEA